MVIMHHETSSEVATSPQERLEHPLTPNPHKATETSPRAPHRRSRPIQSRPLELPYCDQPTFLPCVPIEHSAYKAAEQGSRVK